MKLVSGPFHRLAGRIIEGRSDALQVVLEQAGIRQGAQEYVSKALESAVAAFCVLLAFGAFLLPEPAVLFAFLGSLLVTAIFAAYPSYLRQRRTRQIECELGITLQSIALLLEFGQGFDEAIDAAPKGRIAKAAFKRYSRRVGAGESHCDALNALAKEFDSSAWRRACAQLAFTYHNGCKASYLENSADELFGLQKAYHKKYAKRLEMLGILFVTAGCMLPALFGAFSLVSPMIGQNVSAADIYIAYLAVFPAICIAIALAAASFAPANPDFGLQEA